MPLKPTAPLRAVVDRKETAVVFLKVELPAVIHTLECGHTLEPLIRGGCRLGKEPQRRRCQQCLKEKEENPDANM
jgi:hypothetical protein